MNQNTPLKEQKIGQKIINVLIQRGRKIWRAKPNGENQELKENIDYKLVN